MSIRDDVRRWLEENWTPGDDGFRERAVGTPAVVRDKVTAFVEATGADELIIAHQGPRVEQRVRSAELLAEAYMG